MIFVSKNRVAVPSVAPGGLQAQRSGHFGRCDVFTIVDIENNKVIGVKAVDNVDHTEGGCLVPVNLLAGQGVDSIVVSGMGMRPLLGFREAGIRVLMGEGMTVIDSIKSYINGGLTDMSEDFVCGGH
jgi:predicted Fe-Mo cluster-binding NifX family protein